MAESAEVEQRLSAIWAMGLTKDTRFVPLLWKFRRSEDAALAAGAASACEKILLAQAQAIRDQAIMLPLGAQRMADGGVVARAAALDRTRTPVDLREIHWRPKFGNQPVWQYRVRQVESLPRMAVAVLLPHSSEHTERRAAAFPAVLREGFKAKRAGDSIAVSYYGDAAAPEAPGPDRANDQPRAMLLTADVRMAVQASAPYASSAPGFPQAAGTCLGTLRQFNGGRHLLIVVDRAGPNIQAPEALRKIVMKAREAGVTCHTVTSPGLDAILSEQVQALSNATRGFHVLTEGPDSFGETLALLMPALIRHYEITVQPVDSGDCLDIEVVSDHLTGRARWNLQAVPSVTAASPDIHWEGENALPLEPASMDGRGAASGDSTVRV
jgi:hypothetical protein